MPQQPSNTFSILVDEDPLPDDLVALIASAYVDDSLNLPDMFVLAFRDPGRDVLERTKIEIGKKITISVVSDAAPGGDKLISKAEVTALEAEFEPAGTLCVVRGLDQSHRLFRGRRTESYLNATYSDIAKKVAQRAGLAVGQVDATTEVRDHVSQGNVSDWDFLKDLASRVGYELAVLDGKLDFRKPGEASRGPAPARSGEGTEALQLALGDNLLRFRSVVTSADQVKEVNVRGWDVKQKKALVGSAAGETKSVQLSTKPATLASRFGNPVHVSADTPYDSQSEVDAAAKAMAEEIAGSFAAFDGVARGNPKLKAGAAVSLGLAGSAFDGQYTLTTTRHAYDPLEGYTTWFTVSGRHERSLLGLTSGGNGGSHRRVDGVVPAIVTNAKDPDGLCRVKLKFPWLSDTYETDWVRTVQPGGGGKRGAMVVPEVNDEVLVAFEQGSLRRPYVIGGLYNGVDKPGLPGDQLIDGGGQVNWRAFLSRTGHRLVFSDESGKEHVQLQTGDGKFVLLLDKAKTTIEINSNGKVVVKGTQDVEISSDANIKLKAGANLDIEAGAQLKIKGVQVSVEGSGPVAVKGTPIQLN